MSVMFSHHAILIRTSSTYQYTDTASAMAGVEIVRFQGEKFGIDDARRLVHDASIAPETGFHTRLFYVTTESITEEAQHALLKLLEEPPHTSVFQFVIPVTCHLLGTLESRFSKDTNIQTDAPTSVYEEFSGATYSDRLTRIDAMLTEKDQHWFSDLREGLRAALSSRDHGYDQDTLVALLLILRHLGTRGASNKMLLEELALTLPSRS